MLRCVAVLLCVATSQGIHLHAANQAPAVDLTIRDFAEDSEMQSIIADAARDGITYPDFSELMVVSDELIDPNEEIDLTNVSNAAVSKNADDMVKMVKSLTFDKTVLKAHLKQ